VHRICGGKAEAPGQEARSGPAPDWRATLASLVSALEPCGDRLPADAKDALHAAQEMLGTGGKAGAACTGPAPVAESPAKAARYWLTPESVYARLDEEFHFDCDPCPCPKAEGFNSLDMEWGKSTYVNPPFHQWDGGGNGPTAWVRKGIEEHRKGKTVVFPLPVQSYVNLLIEAGAEVRSAGRVRWLEADTRQPSRSPSPIACFVLR
jgi:DNA N-6-adenine-methyltransferase (Dam)